MENMDKRLTIPKLVLIVRPKVPQMPRNLCSQFVCPSPKVLYFDEKMLHWASIVRDPVHNATLYIENSVFLENVDFSC